MNPATALSVVQGVASKKLMLVMWVLYLLSALAEKAPEKAKECVYVMAGLAVVFLGCQTALDFRALTKQKDTSGTDTNSTTEPGVELDMNGK